MKASKVALILLSATAHARPLEIDGVPVELTVRAAGERCLRVTLKPVDHPRDFPENPALVQRSYPEPAIRLREIADPVTATLGELVVSVRGMPLEVTVSGKDGRRIQKLTFGDEGDIRFSLDDQPVLGLGEGGPRPGKGTDWKKSPVEFDRRGRLHRMEPRWQADAYGSRNPVPLLIGTAGWGLYFRQPVGPDRSEPA
jgi:hypothetical protein